MILVSVLYPNTPGSRFDHDYYVRTHIPLVRERFGPFGLEDVQILKGVGTDGGPPFQVIALLRFQSLDGLQKALAAHGDEVVGDVANFTDVQPQIQPNEPFG
ncbi:EthD family reductase [Arenibaculum pallidiluteum]|uniref:EthD family reductase n=1 Tax=Arenibaculum pallidiluteum TaxID=2812559 RepID=UPI001A962E0A|nr:EthD family reductase [Arenibaculum pallidiluteum]